MGVRKEDLSLCALAGSVKFQLRARLAGTILTGAKAHHAASRGANHPLRLGTVVRHIPTPSRPAAWRCRFVRAPLELTELYARQTGIQGPTGRQLDFAQYAAHELVIQGALGYVARQPAGVVHYACDTPYIL